MQGCSLLAFSLLIIYSSLMARVALAVDGLQCLNIQLKSALRQGSVLAGRFSLRCVRDRWESTAAEESSHT